MQSWMLTEDEWMDLASGRKLERLAGTEEGKAAQLDTYALEDAIKEAGGGRPSLLGVKHSDKLLLFWRGLVLLYAKAQGVLVPEKYLKEAEGYDWLTYERALQFLDQLEFSKSWAMPGWISTYKWLTIRKRLREIGANEAEMRRPGKRGVKKVVISDIGKKGDEMVQLIFARLPDGDAWAFERVV